MAYHGIAALRFEDDPTKGPRLVHHRKSRALRYEYKGLVFDYCEVTSRFIEREGTGLIISTLAGFTCATTGRAFEHADWAIQAYVDDIKGEARNA